MKYYNVSYKLVVNGGISSSLTNKVMYENDEEIEPQEKIKITWENAKEITRTYGVPLNFDFYENENNKKNYL